MAARQHLAFVGAKLALLPPSDLRKKAAINLETGFAELGLALAIKK